MRRLLLLLLACALGLAAAFVFRYLAERLRPCGGEQLACSMTALIGLVYAPIFCGLALIVFAVAEFWKGQSRAHTIALLILLLPFLALVLYIKVTAISVREFHEIREQDIQELLQVVLPILLTLIVPWAVLWTHNARNENRMNAHA